MRHPQDNMASSGIIMTGTMTNAAKTLPAEHPSMTEEVKKPRLPSGECSMVIVEAPAASAPAEKPCAMRQTNSKTVAVIPTCS